MKQALIDYNAEIAHRLATLKPKGIHTRNHELAKEICDYCHATTPPQTLPQYDYKELSMWVAVAKRVGYDDLKAKLEIMKAKGISNPHYLLAMTRNQWKQQRIPMKATQKKSLKSGTPM